MIERLLDRIRTVTFVIVIAIDFFSVTCHCRWESNEGNHDFK
jgi:hypothetical protein